MKRPGVSNGFALARITVVMMPLLGTGLFVTQQYGNWQLARTAISPPTASRFAFPPRGEEEPRTRFGISRSDGIGRLRLGSVALEVIPGLQAYYSTKDGALRHLRLSRESLTITTFPRGGGDQTIVSYADVAAAKIPEAASRP